MLNSWNNDCRAQHHKLNQRCKQTLNRKEKKGIFSLENWGLITNGIHLVKQKRKSDKGAFKYRRSITLCCQCAIPSKAPFPLIERKFPKTFHLEQQNSVFFPEKNTNGSRRLQHNHDRQQLSTDIFLTNFATTSPGPCYPAAEICSQWQYVWLTQFDWVAPTVTAWRSWSTCKHEMSRLKQKGNDKMTSLHLHHVSVGGIKEKNI